MKKKFPGVKYVPSKEIVLLLLLFLFHSLNNIIIIKKDISPPTWNARCFYDGSVNLYKAILNFSFLEALNSFNGYPPLFNLITCPFFYFLGISYDSALMTNLLFLLILLISVYGIGKELYDRPTGLLAAFLVSFFPAIFGFSRIYWLVFPTTTMFALSLYLLFKTELFLNKKFSLILGITMGLSLLINWSYPIYIFLPFSLHLMQAIETNYDNKLYSKKIFYHIFLIFGLAFALASAWYIKNFHQVLADRILLIKNPSFLMPPQRFSIYNELRLSIKFLFSSFVNFLLHPFCFILFIISIVKALFKRYNKKYLLFFTILIPCYLFIFAPPPYESGLKSTRFLVPIIPCAGIIISISILKIKNTLLKNSTIILVILFCFSYFFYLCYLNKKYIFYYKDKHIPLAKYYWDHRVRQGIIRPYTKDWKTEEIFQCMFSKEQTKPVNILLLQDLPPVQGGLIVKRVEGNFIIPYIFNPAEDRNSGSLENSINYAGLIEQSNYILYPLPNISLCDKKILFTFQKMKNEFVEIKKFSLPEEFELSVYQRIKETSNAEQK